MNEGPRRPRVLLVTRNLPPLVGGMERLNWHMAEELAKVAEVRVVGPRGAAALAPSGVHVREVGLKPLWRFLGQALLAAYREAKTWTPDVVLAGSGLMAPIARVAARTCGARYVVYAHGLDVVADHALYRALWQPAIRAADRVIANSHPTAGLCQDIRVPEAKLGIVHPGVDLPGDDTLATAQAGAMDFRAQNGLGDRTLLLSVGRLSARKGLKELVSHALPRIAAACPNVMLVVVGDTPANALHAEAQTPQSLRDAACTAGVEDHLMLLGSVPDTLLESLYVAAEAHVFPVRTIAGDPEGFGMVAVEAASFGLPTVAFASGGVVDAVVDNQSGKLVPPGNYVALADAVVGVLREKGRWHAGCRDHARGFAWVKFGRGVARECGLPVGNQPASEVA